MSYYKTCTYCGSNLDPCETCECQEEKTVVAAQEEKKVIALIMGNKKITKGGK